VNCAVKWSVTFATVKDQLQVTHEAVTSYADQYAWLLPQYVGGVPFIKYQNYFLKRRQVNRQYILSAQKTGFHE
jgi:hypothetical protein